ncbi:cytochrome c oxidase subunit 3 [Mucilaginibacter sp. PAMB04274]|uniref:cytochrome c oxidase subunit 3 n=1 Tax=Mucilaginibacter sp. PAMB04274 TaxID=3138568 RepID=UPI0031F66929
MPYEQSSDRSNLKAKKFMIWLIVTTSFMLFAALGSVFIIAVAQSPSGKIGVQLPLTFAVSTLVIIVSSYTLHLAGRAGMALAFKKQKQLLSATIILGIVFFVLQLEAWNQLIHANVLFKNLNSPQTFIYVLTGAHLLHILIGLILLGYTLAGRIGNKANVRVNLRMDVSAIFWHFLDGLWVFLYLFMLIYQ